MNEMDTASAVADYLKTRQPASTVRANLSVAMGVNPDQEAEFVRLSRQSGIPVDSVRSHAPQVKAQVQAQATDYSLLAQRFPSTTAFLGGMENAKLAHDDIENLSATEAAVRQLKRYGGAFVGGALGDVGGRLSGAGRLYDIASRGMVEALSAIGPEGTRGVLTADIGIPSVSAMFGTAPGRTIKRAGEGLKPSDSSFGTDVASGLGQLSSQIATALFTPAAVSVGGLYAQGADVMGGKVEGDAASQASKDLATVLGATVTGVTEKYALDKIMGPLAVPIRNQMAAALARIGIAAASEGGQEMAESILQDTIRQMVTNPDAEIDLKGAAYEGGVGATVGGIARALIESALHVKRRGATQEQRTQEAQEQAEVLAGLDNLAKASKVRGRDVQTYETFIASALEDGPVPDLYIDPNALAQSGVTIEELAEVSKSAADQLRQAVVGGTDIRIPTAEFAASIAGTDLAAKLIPHLKTDADGMSQAEAEAYMREQGDSFKAQIEETLAQREGSDAFNAARDAVALNIQNQLDLTQRFTPDVNKQYAALVASRYAALGQRLGQSPEEVFRQYPLRIQAQGVMGGALNQGAVQTETPEFRNWFGESKVVDEAGAPLVVYHGTGGDITQFKVSERGEFGGGIYLTPDTRGASDYAMYRGQGPANVMPVFVSIKNPAGAAEASQVASWKGEENAQAELIRRGYDGVIDMRSGQIVAFRPEQIKSAIGNRGTFDPNDPSILNKDDNRGAYSPSTDTITILKGADLSTALHEFGHFFLELETRIASRPDAPQEIRDDVDTLLQWFGIQPEPDADRLTVWNRLTLDQQRESHEKFARGFEAYLFEGRAPSVELRGIFQRFRSWLVNVYQSLKALNVTLTDEVRGVMDRMVATQQEIETAEAARSMGMLFKTEAEARGFGVDWQAYQARGNDATQRAMDELGARGLKDMQWLDGAKSRLLKRLQKDAQEKRREVRQEARREVLNRPVYRAWQFLTGKLEKADIIVAPDVPKSAPNTLDPSVDSLFVAIAKLGGLNKDEVVGAWGIDPAERSAMPVFGKPVVRTNGGRSIDSMAEALYEAGYLMADQDGRYDPRELEDKFELEYRGEAQYSMAVDPRIFGDGARPGENLNLQALTAARFDLTALKNMGLPDESVRLLVERKMTAKNGLDPDLVADLPGFGFESGGELVAALLEALPPREAVEAETDRMMLERYGDITSPEALDTAVNEAIHNKARARMVATELAALETALGESEDVKRGKKTAQRKTLPAAAKRFAAETVAALKIRDIRPSQFAASAARAAKATEKALKAGDLETAAREKRNQLVNTYAAKAAEEAKQEAEKARQYFRKFDAASVRKAVNPTFTDQIDALLERYEFRRISDKDLDRRLSLADWVKQQEDAGTEPDIPKRLLDGIDRKNYREMTVEELRGLVDTVKQIEHLGRLKNKLLTAKTDREYKAIRDEIAASVLENGQGREADTRTPTTNMGRFMQGIRTFGSAHIKAATWARIMDGGKDGGPVWEYIIRPANAAADFETQRRADATQALTDIMAPVMAGGKMGGKGRYFASVGRSLNRESIFTMALNTGNASNLQRLLGGEGWTIEQIKPVLETLSKSDWDAVQAVWDFFESMRPEIAAKERRVFGKEPSWIEPTPVVTKHGTYRGGYFPVIYDAAASARAEENADAESAKAMLKGAHNAATTRRSFTKSRVEEVVGRPLVLTLQGMYRGVNDVIHDLAWHEWLIDTNRLLRSDTIDKAMRGTYGPLAVRQFKTWREAIAVGDSAASEAIDTGLGRLRQGVSMAGLSYNVVSALIQPLGITQSITRIGAKWVGVGLKQYIASPIKTTRMVHELSEFMANRSRTRFRELNELRNRIEAADGGAMEAFKRHGWWMMLRMQQTVDMPTWMGAYEKAMAEDGDESRAIALADQAVKDAQGSGLTMDLSAIERGGQAAKLFTVFYSFMNTTLNLAAASKMTRTSRVKFVTDLLLLTVIPAVLMVIVKDALVPGDDGEDDEAFYKKMAAATLDNMLGLFVLGREVAMAAKLATGLEDFGDYRGPAGLRVISDATGLAKQVGQLWEGGELDDAFRKSAVNLVGSLFGLPAAQINRTWTGTEAIIEGKTENPGAVLTGFKEPR